MDQNSDKDRSSRLKSIIKNTPIFDGLSEEEVTGLEKIIVEKRFSRNEVVLMEMDRLKYMYFVCSGKVKAVHMSVDGREHILAVHGKGESFGEMGILDGKNSPATVIAIEDSEIGFISKQDFQKHLLGNSKFLRQFILLLCSRLREAWLRIQVNTLSRAENRVRAALELLSKQYGVKDSRGTVINLRLTHKDLARHVSLSRETVSRKLSKLSDAGEIEILESKHVLLKPAFFNNSASMIASDGERMNSSLLTGQSQV